jgi:hypothetical protein
LDRECRRAELDQAAAGAAVRHQTPVGGDPERALFAQAHQAGVLYMVEVDSTGCEALRAILLPRLTNRASISSVVAPVFGAASQARKICACSMIQAR